MKPFKLNILSPQRELYSGEATFLAVKTPDGEIGLLADHAPLISLVSPGTIRFELENGEKRELKGSDGLLQAGQNRVQVILQ